MVQAGVVPPEARALADFWRAAGFERWFSRNDDFDAELRARFLPAHEAAARGELDGWLETPDGALALLLLLDQLPRNLFRGTPRMYATDAAGLRAAEKAITLGHDRRVEPALQVFFYLPHMHSEELADQERCVALTAGLEERVTSAAREHLEIVARFGRFPHRNAILGRETTPEERRFLDEGGFAG
ncbi:DUF924 family protein [Roseomonas sp. WA12]